jgi:hypothetical protein
LACNRLEASNVYWHNEADDPPLTCAEESLPGHVMQEVRRSCSAGLGWGFFWEAFSCFFPRTQYPLNNSAANFCDALYPVTLAPC